MSISLDSFHKFLKEISYRGVCPNLDRIGKALEILDHPQRAYKVIHIAGTNGKGSVCSFVSHLLSKSGYRVGMTMSPHVYDYRERVQITNPDDQGMMMIPEKDLLTLHESLVKILPESLGLTFFEWATLLAVQYFKEQKVEYAVLETGLGGRWDGSNISDSVLSAITTIGYDHMDYLGDTLEKILDEKLQIIKKDSDFLFGPQDPELISQAKEFCESRGARFHLFRREEKEERRQKTGGRRHEIGESYLDENLRFALCLARILEGQGCEFDYDRFFDNLDQAIPPGRMEVLSENPLIIMDGAHNEEGLRVLRRYLNKQYDGEYDLVFGCLKNKPFLKLADIIRSKGRNFWAVFDGDKRTTPLESYEEVKGQLGGEIVEFDDDFKEKIIKPQLNKPIVVCGSFYLCSQFKDWLLI